MIGRRHGQAAQQKRVDDRKRGGDGADAQGERADGDQREAGAALHRAQGVRQVVRELLERAERKQIVAGFLDERGVPELEVSGAARLGGRETLRSILVFEELEVKEQLVRAAPRS